ncbi:hypothetical protein [Pseudonocardia sp. NPDC046786]|uniref:hypothetical protein n=1 Tax=Pseudonocardia sp. NPDC046786 TaxID=3155471 RepID=UPI0033D223EA
MQGGRRIGQHGDVVERVPVDDQQSACAPGAATPISPSARSSRAAVVVAERATSAEDTTGPGC